MPSHTAISQFVFPQKRKTILRAVYSAKSGGLNHIATVLTELVEAMDGDKLIELAQLVKEKSYFQRMGYLLEAIDAGSTARGGDIIEQLKNFINTTSKSDVPLAPELATTGCPRSKAWRIIANTNVENDLWYQKVISRLGAKPRIGLESKKLNRDFQVDMGALLPHDTEWDFEEAFEFVVERVVARI